MRGSHEQLIADDAPSPALLEKVLAQGIVAGKEHKRLRMRQGGRKLVLPSEVTVPEDQEALRDRRYEQVWACIVGKNDNPRPEWNMRIISRYHVTELNIGIGSIVITYTFGWSKLKTNTANRQVAIAPVPERDIADDIESFAVEDDMAMRWGWENQLSLVTEGDAQLLLRDLENFSGRISPNRLETNRPTNT